MRARRGGVLAATAAAALLASCATGTPQALHPTTPPRSGQLPASTGATSAHRGTPFDVGRVRLWLPSRWRLVSASCLPGSKMMCAPSCPPGADDTINVAPYARVLGCSTVDRGVSSVWVAPRRLGSGRATWRRLGIGHGSVVVQVPALGVTLYGFSPAGARVAEAFGASTLERVLTATLPVAVPRGWRRVAYGALSVEVPPRWPVRHLNGSNFMDPGACGTGDFSTPTAVTGFSLITPMCPRFTPDVVLRWLAHPVDGAWLQAPGTWLDGASVAVRHSHGMVVDLRAAPSLQGSNALQVVVVDHGARGDLVLGLGPTPRIAEAILSSLRLSARS